MRSFPANMKSSLNWKRCMIYTMQHKYKIGVAHSELAIKQLHAAPPDGEITITSYPGCNKTSFSQKPCIIQSITTLILNNIYVKKLKHLTLCVQDNDRTKTANKKIVVLQAWYIFTRTRTIAMCYFKCKLARGTTCDFCDRNPLNGFKINSHWVMKGITLHVRTILNFK